MAFAHDDTLLAAGCDNGVVLIFKRTAPKAATSTVSDGDADTGMDDTQARRAGGGEAAAADTKKTSTAEVDAGDDHVRRDDGPGGGDGRGGGDNDDDDDDDEEDDEAADLFEQEPLFVLKPGGAVALSAVLSVTAVSFSTDGRYVRAEFNGSGAWGGTMHRSTCFAPVVRVWDLQVSGMMIII